MGWGPLDTTHLVVSTKGKKGKFDKCQPKETIKSGGYKNRVQITETSFYAAL